MKIFVIICQIFVINIIMDNNKDDGFNLIWLYWVKKYMNDKMRPKDSIQDIIVQLKRHYTLQTLDTRLQLQAKLASIRQNKGKAQWPIYIIDPQRELKLIQANLNQQYEQYRSEIYSYYLNIKTIFVIYCNDWQGSENLSEKGGSLQDNNNDNISEGNRNQRYKSMIKQLDNRTEGNKSIPKAQSSGIINRIFHSCVQDESSQCRNQSLAETVQTKIQELEVLNKIAELDGMEIWNCKYKKIPHTYLKIKNQSWKPCLSFPLMHPAQPRLIGNYPIMPQIQPFQPSIDKLLPFVSYLKLLDRYFPGFVPTKDSIFQMNDLPLVFSRELEGGWNEQSNVGLLCFYVANGDDQNLTSTRVERWAEMNGESILGKTIKEMNKRHRQRKVGQNESKPFSLFQNDVQGKSIW